MLKKLIHTTLLVTACLTLPAQAQFAKAEDAIKYRQSALFVMGQHFTRLAAMAQGKIPFDAKAAADNAALVETMSKLPWAAFGEGTDQGGNTKAKPASKWYRLGSKRDPLDEVASRVVAGDFSAVPSLFRGDGQPPAEPEEDFAASGAGGYAAAAALTALAGR